MEDSHDNKALHFDVRFDHLGDRELVVRNAKTMGSFRRDESERSIPKFPFAPGKDFDIVFLCTDDRFKVFMAVFILIELFANAKRCYAKLFLFGHRNCIVYRYPIPMLK